MKKNTRRIIVLFSFLFIVNGIFAQSYYGSDKKDKEYFVAFSYGIGTARWYSHFYDASLYNIDGSVLKSGDLKMKASNPMYCYNFSVCAPVAGIRLGAGICFEKFSMDKLSILSTDSANTNVPNSYVLFTENFWFNEIYGMMQAPFKFCKGKPYSLDFIMNAGFYGYNGIKRLNFFGNDQVASTYLVNAGFLFDCEVIEHSRIFIYPEIEYKYFHNNRNENPSIIKHNIFTAILSFGVRTDISKF